MGVELRESGVGLRALVIDPDARTRQELTDALQGLACWVTSSAPSWAEFEARKGDDAVSGSMHLLCVSAELVDASLVGRVQLSFPEAQVLLVADAGVSMDGPLQLWSETKRWPSFLRRPFSELELRALLAPSLRSAGQGSSSSISALPRLSPAWAVLDELPDFFYQCRSDGSVRSLASSFSERTGLPVGNFVDAYEAAFRGAASFEGATSPRFRVLTLLRLDGSPLDLELLEVPGSALLGGGALGLARDLSCRRQFEKEQRVTEKLEALRRMAGGLAHDFNDLLTIICGEADLLLDGPGEVAARAILEAAERAADMTRRLMNFGQRSSAQGVEVNLSDLTRDCLRLFGRMLSADIELEMDLGAKNRIRVAPTDVTRVLLSILTNAVEAMPQGGRLRVTTADIPSQSPLALPTPEGLVDAVALSIEDTGEGMSAESQSRMFDPFFSTRQLGDGRGLGLSETHGIVRRLGGLLRVYSERGVGTRLDVLLPSASGPDRECCASPNHTEKPKLVLLVEDDDQVRSLTTRVLERAGFQVLSVGVPTEASELDDAVLAQVSIMVSDVVMPRLSGPELYDQLQARRPNLRALFVTGYSSEYLDDEIVGGTGFLRKPWKREDLLAAIGRCLKSEPA